MNITEPSWKAYLIFSTDPVFTPEQCQKIIEVGKAEKNVDALIGSGKKVGPHKKKDLSVRQSKIAWLPFSKLTWMYQIIEHWMHLVNNNHMGFDVLKIGENAQYTTYTKKGHYNWHTDIQIHMGQSPPVRKMSMITLLNDPKEFKGGELEIFAAPKKISLKQGHAVFFASFVGHRSLPVTQGTKISMPIWFNGQPYR